MAHARRNVHESRDLASEFCGRVLASMSRLYAVEADAKRRRLDHAQRLTLRRERAAAFFTLLVSARLHEVEPWAWLRDEFDRMAQLRAAGDDGDDSLRPLLPQNWLAEHSDKRVPYGR